MYDLGRMPEDKLKDSCDEGKTWNVEDKVVPADPILSCDIANNSGFIVPTLRFKLGGESIKHINIGYYPRLNGEMKDAPCFEGAFAELPEGGALKIYKN